MEIILASKSPRRRELLGKLGLEFRILTAEVDETMDPRETPEEAVREISARKASAAAALASEDALIVCADTIVVLSGKIMGKPKDRADAVGMLSKLSGRTHTVFTGVTVRRGETVQSIVERTEVSFRPLASAEIEAYVDSGEPMDKAGSYGVQGTGASFVRHLDGDFFNVMGLPLCALTGLLRSFGVKILGC